MHSARAEESVSMQSIKWRAITIVALVVASAFALVPRSVKQRIYDSKTGQMRDTTIRRVPIKLGLNLSGGVHLALEVDQSRGVIADCADAIRRAERVVRTRIDEFGTTEPVVQIAGNCRLVVELAGETDPARARSIVERTAFPNFASPIRGSSFVSHFRPSTRRCAARG
jgi:preprotein translocase subunit SecD